jgi:PadR family transcriptional regulator
MKITHSLVQVMLALVESPQDRHWGYDLSKRAGVRSGVLYPILRRMLEQGWLSDGWEDPSETGGSRPPRRYYVLTEEGLSQAGLLLTRARSDARFKALMGSYA